MHNTSILTQPTLWWCEHLRLHPPFMMWPLNHTQWGFLPSSEYLEVLFLLFLEVYLEFLRGLHGFKVLGFNRVSGVLTGNVPMWTSLWHPVIQKSLEAVLKALGDYRGSWGDPGVGMAFQEYSRGFQECHYGDFKMWFQESLREFQGILKGQISKTNLSELVVVDVLIVLMCLGGSWIISASVLQVLVGGLCGLWNVTAVLQRVLGIHHRILEGSEWFFMRPLTSASMGFYKYFWGSQGSFRWWAFVWFRGAFRSPWVSSNYVTAGSLRWHNSLGWDGP